MDMDVTIGCRTEHMTSSVKSIGVPAQAVGLTIFLAATAIAAWLGNLATMTSVGDWYPALVKPAWTPPDWLFGPVWSVLYLLMAVSAWLVWRKRGWRAAAWPLGLYAGQLALNSLWSFVFFGLREPSWAAAEIVVLWLAIAATLIAFWRCSIVAGLLLVPYLAWVTFAAALNFSIASMNS
jgi:tryptophan-rich sensory protein